MTMNSVANSQPTPQAADTPAVELSWDDVVDGTFPPTRQQRWQQAALQAAEQLQEQTDLPVTHDRLTKALDLVRHNAVALTRITPPASVAAAVATPWRTAAAAVRMRSNAADAANTSWR